MKLEPEPKPKTENEQKEESFEPKNDPEKVETLLEEYSFSIAVNEAIKVKKSVIHETKAKNIQVKETFPIEGSDDGNDVQASETFPADLIMGRFEKEAVGIESFDQSWTEVREIKDDLDVEMIEKKAANENLVEGEVITSSDCQTVETEDPDLSLSEIVDESEVDETTEVFYDTESSGNIGKHFFNLKAFIYLVLFS